MQWQGYVWEFLPSRAEPAKFATESSTTALLSATTQVLVIVIVVAGMVGRQHLHKSIIHKNRWIAGISDFLISVLGVAELLDGISALCPVQWQGYVWESLPIVRPKCPPNVDFLYPGLGKGSCRAARDPGRASPWPPRQNPAPPHQFPTLSTSTRQVLPDGRVSETLHATWDRIVISHPLFFCVIITIHTFILPGGAISRCSWP